MALSFHPTTAPLFGHLPAPDAAAAADMMSLLQDVHPEVTDALLGFVYDPLDPDNAALDDFLHLPPHGDAALLGPLGGDGEVERHRHCAKKQRACGDDAWRGLVDIGAGGQQVPELRNEFVLPVPPPPPPPPTELPEPVALLPAAGAKKATDNVSQSVQSAAARQRRRRISDKTAELSRLIPGGHKLNTAEMLEAAARHVKLLQAQVGMLALLHSVGSTEKEKVSSMAALEKMHALLARGGVQERLAAEGKCLVPRELVDAVAKDSSVRSSAVVSRDLGRFVASLQGQ